MSSIRLHTHFSTVSDAALLSKFKYSVRRIGAGPALTVNWMTLLQTHYASVPGYWMIRPVSNDADLRLMLGGIGDAGQAHDGSRVLSSKPVGRRGSAFLGFLYKVF